MPKAWLGNSKICVKKNNMVWPFSWHLLNITRGVYGCNTINFSEQIPNEGKRGCEVEVRCQLLGIARASQIRQEKLKRVSIKSKCFAYHESINGYYQYRKDRDTYGGY